MLRTTTRLLVAFLVVQLGEGDQQPNLTARIFHSHGSFTDTVDTIKFVAYSVVANFIVGVGLVGNLLNLVVLSRPNLKGVMYVYLLGLAVSNLCVLLTAIPGLYDISSGLEDGTYTTAFYQAHLKLPMINSFMASSVYIIICMTVNRYISIYKPTQFQRFHTHKNARISILSAFAGGILVHVPLCFQNRVISSCTLIDHLDVVNDVDKSTEGDIYQKQDSWRNLSSNDTPISSGSACVWKSEENFLVSENIVFKIYLIISEIILRVGPILALAILNALIIHKFMKIARKRQVLKGYVSKPEISQHMSSTHSSPQPSRNTSSTTQSSSAPSTSSGPRLTVPAAANPCRTPSPEPSSCTPEVTPAHRPAKRTSRRKPRSLQNAEERMLVIVLISIVVLFVCCTTPAAILSLFFTSKYDKNLGFQVFRAVANNLELLNFALNFYIYCLCSAEIRRAFVSLFTKIYNFLAVDVPGGPGELQTEEEARK